MDTVDLIIKSSTEFYNDLKSDENGRYRSWEHCYSHFMNARGRNDVDYDYLSLQLAFYLASWGMYRGSSFLLQKDYRVHIPVVKELLNEKYDALAGIDCIGFRDESNHKLLQDINSFLEQYYDKIRHEVKEQELKNQLSFTLITKILMGTLPKIEKTTGCKMKYTDFIKERIMTFITDITSEYKRVFEIGSRYPDIALTLLKQAFSYAMFDNTNEVNIFHIEKAIQNSKNIYPDVIKKELPRFETEFKDIITEEKTGISRIYGTSINPAPPSYTETNPKEAVEKEEPVRSNNKVPQREATTEFSSNGMSEELYSLLNANAVPVHVPKEKEVDNGVIPITPSKNDDTEIILDDIDDTDNINDDFFEE